eukprot:GEMP01074283.1.p1 GENE.GEMP01074283.1~~GEMP01074283.1.p1  ORF type:complete len:146 (+),score=19.34 GEMP01074283.1:41-439(+)
MSDADVCFPPWTPFNQSPATRHSWCDHRFAQEGSERSGGVEWRNRTTSEFYATGTARLGRGTGSLDVINMTPAGVGIKLFSDITMRTWVGYKDALAREAATDPFERRPKDSFAKILTPVDRIVPRSTSMPPG